MYSSDTELKFLCFERIVSATSNPGCESHENNDFTSKSHTRVDLLLLCDVSLFSEHHSCPLPSCTLFWQHIHLQRQTMKESNPLSHLAPTSRDKALRGKFLQVAPKSTLCLLDKVQAKAIHLINNPNLTKSLQPLSHRRLVGDLSIYYIYFNGHCSQEIRDIIPVPLRRVRTTRSSTHSHPFQVSLPNPRTLSHKSFIPRTCNLWNVLPSSCFLAFLSPTTCHLSNLM